MFAALTNSNVFRQQCFHRQQGWMHSFKHKFIATHMQYCVHKIDHPATNNFFLISPKHTIVIHADTAVILCSLLPFTPTPVCCELPQYQEERTTLLLYHSTVQLLCTYLPHPGNQNVFSTALLILAKG